MCLSEKGSKGNDCPLLVSSDAYKVLWVGCDC